MMCTCEAQLQPHDRMPRVCPPAVEKDPPKTDVFDELWLDLGGEA